MNTEGIGQHAPRPLKEVLTSSDMQLVAQVAFSQSKFRGYGQSTNGWKRGLIGGLKIPGVGDIPGDVAPRVIGLAGEAALVLFLNRRADLRLSLDDRLRASGDGGCDIELPSNWVVQVKARQGGKSHSRERLSLIRYARDDGTVVYPKADFLVLCETEIEDRVVWLLGWSSSTAAKHNPIVPARKGSHTNIELPDTQLLPMSRFVDRIRARKELP